MQPPGNWLWDSHQGMRHYSRVRHPVAIAALVTCMAAASDDGRAPLVLTCSNPASGATWQISVDLGKSTVDANPARIDAYHEAVARELARSSD